MNDASGQPVLRIVHGGEPTAEELVALTVAIVARRAATKAPITGAPVSRWADRRGRLRRPLHPGPGSWVASARH